MTPAAPATSEWGRERRRAPRYSLTVPVKVLYGDGDKAEQAQFGFTSDVSSRGALLLLPRQIALGTSVEFRVSMPRDLQNIRSQFVEVLVHGRVARLIAISERTGVGVEILDLDQIGEA